MLRHVLALGLVHVCLSSSPNDGTVSVAVTSDGASAVGEARLKDNEKAQPAAARSESQGSLLHPDYPQLPLAQAQTYKYGAPINLDFPGLQLGQCALFFLTVKPTIISLVGRACLVPF